MDYLRFGNVKFNYQLLRLPYQEENTISGINYIRDV